MIESSYYTWINASSKWRHMSRNTIQYNTNNSYALYLVEAYNANADTLVPSGRSIYSYDANENQTIVLGESWDATASAWLQNSKYENFFDCGNTTSVAALGNEVFAVYPNPAQNILNVDLAEESILEVYALSGKLMNNFTSDRKHTVNISDYATGMYLVKAGSNIKRFIKE